MSFPFNPQQRLIMVHGELEGPAGTADLDLALDTGASRTVLSTSALVAVGYDPALALQHARVATGSRVEYLPLFTVSRFEALGQVQRGLIVVAHTLPTSGIDGVIGLDFLRGWSLTVDFRQGLISLT